jgi:hypothetical protein
VISNNGKVTQSLTKTNLYRAGVGQPDGTLASASGTTYCQQYAASGIFIAANQQLFQAATSPAPATANNLFTFLANRFATSFGPVPSLGCQDIFGLKTSPVKQTLDGNGVVVSATIDTATLQVGPVNVCAMVNCQIANCVFQQILSGKTAAISGTAAGAAKTSTTTKAAAASPTAKQGTDQTKHKVGNNTGARSVLRHRMLRDAYEYVW